jgi:CRP/FNR family transcriptional regulator, anaerobic regulatory protein
MLKERSQVNISCTGCSFSHLCMARQFSETDKKRLDGFIQKAKYIKKGEHLYRSNEKLEYLYAVYSGTLKDYYFDENGAEYINNFYLPGDVMALESLAKRNYVYSAVALSDAVLCMIPVNNLFTEMQTFPALLKRFFQINSFKMLNDKHIRPTTNAKHRVADFLINILYRLKERSDAESTKMQLPMTQVDMSNMIGIAYETVSRILHQLADDKIIQISNKSITVLNPKLLSTMGNDTRHLGQMASLSTN